MGNSRYGGYAAWKGAVALGAIGLAWATAAGGQAAGALKLEIIQQAASVLQGEPINLVIELKNTGERAVTVPGPPSVIHWTVLMEVTQRGRAVRRKKEWSAARWSVPVDIPPGGSLKSEFDLGWLYEPTGLEPGVYAVRALYEPEKGLRIVSDAVTVEVRPLPKEEEAALKAMLEATRVTEDFAACATRGADFLAKYPKSIFTDRVRLHTAFCLWKAKRHEESLVLYREVAESKTAPQWRKQTALRGAARALYEQGRKPEAIEAIRKVGTREAESQARGWEEELRKEQAKQQEKKPAEEKK